MRCKPGQKAWVIKGEPPENIGRMIKVIELLPVPQWVTRFWGPIWKYEGNLTDGKGGRLTGAADDCLFPIDEDNIDLEKDGEKLWETLPIDEKEKL